jgi:uncharacterized protein DUF5329
MKRCLPAVLGLMVGLMLSPAVRSAPPSIAQTEINYLIGFLGNSGCEFYRNGIWYDSKAAETHLREKYTVLEGGDRIRSSEDFIEQVATKSSLSGQPYQIKCSGGEALTTNQWLYAALARFRASGAGAPHISRGAPGFNVSAAN